MQVFERQVNQFHVKIFCDFNIDSLIHLQDSIPKCLDPAEKKRGYAQASP